MDPYKVFIHLGILEEIPKSGKTRAQIMEFIQSLADEPMDSGDYSEKDDGGRTLYTKLIGDFAITYWPDTPVKEVKIVKVGRADGRLPRTP